MTDAPFILLDMVHVTKGTPNTTLRARVDHIIRRADEYMREKDVKRVTVMVSPSIGDVALALRENVPASSFTVAITPELHRMEVGIREWREEDDRPA